MSLPTCTHLLRYPHESVSGGFPCLPPGTESLQKRSRCLIPSPPGTEIPQKRSRWHVPPSTWHSFPAKACQVSHPAFHLPRKSRKSVSGVPSRLPPATEISQKRVRCPIPPSTCHGIPAKACQVSHPAFHLPRKSRKIVSGVPSRFPPATESLQKRVRCLFPLPTCYGIPTKACQVVFPVSHLARNPCKSVPGVSSRLHLARNPRKSVSGVLSRCPPATESPQKRVRCLFPLPTCYGIPTKVFQVSLPAVHLPRNPCESVSGSTSCLPPGTESPQKRVR